MIQSIPARRSWMSLVGVVLLSSAAPLSGVCQEGETNTVIPLIICENAPLNVVIQELAKKAGINLILDPRLIPPPSAVGEYIIDFKGTNLTAPQALDGILDQEGLKKVESAGTSVTRIVPASQVPSAGAALTDTNPPLPRIEMDKVSLETAIKKLAAEAKIKVEFEPRLRDPAASDSVLSKTVVPFTWRNLTARRALAALLDNYDLVLIENAASSTGRVTLRSAEKSTSNPKAEPKPGKNSVELR